MPARVRIGVEGAEEAQRFLELAPQAQTVALEAAVRDTVDALFAASQDEVPVDKGTLKKSGTFAASGFTGDVAYNTSYALFVHEGTKPHPIEPVNAPLLAFPPSGARGVYRGGKRVGLFEFGGKKVIVPLVFARRVMHPGTQANPWLERALALVQEFIPEFVKRRITEEFGKVGLSA